MAVFVASLLLYEKCEKGSQRNEVLEHAGSGLNPKMIKSECFFLMSQPF